MAWLLRLRTWFIGRHRSRSVNSTLENSLKSGSVQYPSVEELQSAKREVIKHVQFLSFPELIQAMQTISLSKPSSQVTSELENLEIPAHMRKLHPLLDDIGILRVGGRLENSLVSYMTQKNSFNFAVSSSSCYRFDHFLATPKSWPPWSRVSTVQFTSVLLDNHGTFSCPSSD